MSAPVMLRPVMLRPGDVFVSRSPSWLGRLIRWFTRSPGEPPTRVTHCGIVSGHGRVDQVKVIEAARQGVVERSLLDGHLGEWVAVYRPVGLDAELRLVPALRALSKVGAKYPVWRLVAHLLDWLLLDAYLFRRVARSGRVMECSHLVAWAFERIYTFSNVPSWAVNPDDIDDACWQDNKTWAVILELVPLEEA